MPKSAESHLVCVFHQNCTVAQKAYKLSLGDLFSIYLKDGMPCLHHTDLERATPTMSGAEEREQTLVTGVSWFFSPLWSPRTKTQRWGFGTGKESERVEAWLDDHSDFTRAYFLRRSSTASGQTLKIPQLLPKLPTVNSDMLAVARRQRASFPLPGRRPFISSSTRDRADHQVSNRASPEWLDPSSPDIPTGSSSHPARSLRYPCSPLSSPHLPRSTRSPRPPRHATSKKKTSACERGESCVWMLGILKRGVSHMGSVAKVCQGALLHTGELVAAEHCVLSLVNQAQGNTLEKVAGLTSLRGVKEDSPSWQAHLELVKGIMGYVVATGSPMNIRDAREDPRFNVDESQSSDFTLRSVLSMPIKNHREKVVGVAVMFNKRSSGEDTVSLFTDLDEKILSNHMGFLGIVLDNAQLYESSRQEAKRSQVLIEMAKVLSEEHHTFQVLMGKMAATIMPFTHAQYCTIFITMKDRMDSFSQVIHMECEDLGPTCQIYRRQRHVDEVDRAYALQTLQSMEPLNVADTAQDSHRSLICCPVRNERSDKVIAVCQLKDKRGKDSIELEAFTKYDERLLADLAVYCGLALQYVHTVQITEKRRASIEVTQQVLAYHITATEEEIRALQEAPIPSAQSLHILDFHFTDFGLPEDHTTQATIRMFLDLNLVQTFNIDYKSLCQWVLSVKRGYRNNVPYHNWSHGLSTAQCMFALLKSTDQLQAHFSQLEILALMIATLNHDLDHRGVSNSYIVRSHQPLAQLYGHSSLENHHYNLCFFILHNSGSEILSGLSKEDYKAILQMIKRAILATDLTVYMQRRSEFFSLAKKGEEECWRDEKQRELLRSMLMTASDICAISKPWPEQKRIANLVAMEFFAQGDKEREEFNIKPIDIMNRENSTRLPHMQVEYIDEICKPLYKALSGLFDTCSPLLNGCQRNREHWLQLAEGGEGEEEELNEE